VLGASGKRGYFDDGLGIDLGYGQKRPTLGQIARWQSFEFNQSFRCRRAFLYVGHL